MSVAENIALLKRQTEEFWIARDLDKMDEFFDEALNSNVFKSRAEAKKLLEKIFADQSTRVVKVDYHEIVGEGDIVFARQTNHQSNGVTVEGVTLAEFKNGKIIRNSWYTTPSLPNPG